MTSLTYDEANDAILGTFKTAWDTTGYTAYYEGVRGDRDAALQPFAQVFVRHRNGRQASLGGRVAGQKMWRREGDITIQIMVPVSQGLSTGLVLAKVVADAFEGQQSPGGVWYRNVRPNEIGREGSYEQVNVIAEFLYDEIK